jgi:ATP-binding cassette, subfamily B, bacterial MsbA
VLSIAISDAVHHRSTMGDLLAFLVALVGISQPLRSLVSVAGPLQQGIAAGQSIFELLDEPAEPQGGSLIATRVRGDIELDHVSFSYPVGKGITLQDVSLKIPAGRVLAIVGKTGSGKSTLVNLLPRFIEPTSGALLLDDAPLPAWNVQALRRQFALVSQDVVLFNDSIAENVCLGDELDRERVRQALRGANLLDFVAGLPQGMDSRIGHNGSELSGGQRQRLAIARAIYKDAPILILDEATSALDSESERLVQTALERLMQGRTSLVIAHRLSTIERADRIVALEGGRVVEQGSHAELLARGGLYARLHALQFRS